jgi:hypothetical protein
MSTRRNFLKKTGLLSASAAALSNTALANDMAQAYIQPNLNFTTANAERTDLASRLRAVHLDFHTTGLIDDVAVNFDAQSFVETLKKADINSINIFAKCHHGMNYYPTKVGKVHPGMKRKDLMGEMLEVLHKNDMRAPIYTPVGWDEHTAITHPEWRQRKKDGSFANASPGADPGAVNQAPWKYVDFVNPDYQDYFESHLNEILDNYDVDGMWIDIVFYNGDGSYSDAARKFRAQHGLEKETWENHVRFEMLAQEKFCERFTAQIKAKKPKASIFYNTPNNMYVDGNDGVLRRGKFQTHFEIESLPSGEWGYFHFPRLARRIAYKGKTWVGMTGKFQKMWGDFGGLKPQSALEFECFRSQALGGGNSVGDQMHPRGILDKGSYELIGSVFSQLKKAEPFYAGSQGIPQVGVLSPNYPAFNEGAVSTTEEGVVLMMEELHYDCAMLDDTSDLSGFNLIVLPDTVVVTDLLKTKLDAYLAKGGKMMISYKSGFDKNGKWAISQIPLENDGDVKAYPTFWKPVASLGVSESERVFYQQGLKVRITDPAYKVMVDRVVPYFERNNDAFCSHFQTPPKEVDTKYPSVVSNGQITYFADPIFKEYRKAGNLFLRNTIQKLIENAVGKPMVGAGLPASVMVVPRKKGTSLLVTLLNYIPVRKALDIDVIEAGQSFGGELLNVSSKVATVKCVTNGKLLPKAKAGQFVLPNIKGRVLLEIPNYFA